jgi:RNA-directed DNA polymerase
MKRLNNLYQHIYSIENLMLADTNARIGKKKRYGISVHDRNKEVNIIALHESLRDKKYQTSKYSIFKVYEPKEREVYRLPYYPDRVLHHAIMNVLKPVFVSTFTADTYSCIEGKGIHDAHRNLKKALKDVPNTTYCLKLDVKKFYPNVDHNILKQQLRRKFKDRDLLWLLDEIIDSAPGLPIGNYLSQFFANFYLTPFDHYIKEVVGVAHYFRYMDDIVILSGDKEYLHQVLAKVREYFGVNLKLTIKSNYQIFPVAARGIDFVGYVFFHTHILLRKTIKKNFARKMVKGFNLYCLAAYYGWAKHCDSKHLMKKIVGNERLERFKHSGATSQHRSRRRQNTGRADTQCEGVNSGLSHRGFDKETRNEMFVAST